MSAMDYLLKMSDQENRKKSGPKYESHFKEKAELALSCIQQMSPTIRNTYYSCLSEYSTKSASDIFGIYRSKNSQSFEIAAAYTALKDQGIGIPELTKMALDEIYPS
ncbi:MAG: hypothetical protein ABW166_09620 [Sedimenticola sp.]